MKFSTIKTLSRDKLLLSDMYMTKLKRLVTGVGRPLAQPPEFQHAWAGGISLLECVNRRSIVVNSSDFMRTRYAYLKGIDIIGISPNHLNMQG